MRAPGDVRSRTVFYFLLLVAAVPAFVLLTYFHVPHNWSAIVVGTIAVWGVLIESFPESRRDLWFWELLLGLLVIHLSIFWLLLQVVLPYRFFIGYFWWTLLLVAEGAAYMAIVQAIKLRRKDAHCKD